MSLQYSDITGRPVLEVMKSHLTGLLLLNGSILFITCFFASDGEIMETFWLGLIGFAQIVAAFRLALANEVKPWQVHLGLILVLACIAGCIAVMSTVAILPMMYVWPVLFVGYHFSLRQTVGYGVGVLTSFVFAMQYSSYPAKIETLVFTSLAIVCLLTVMHWVKIQVRAHVDKLMIASTHDKLTDIYNRSAFEEYFNAQWRRGANGERYALAILDLDYFKQINDAYGHKAGDIALQDFTAIVQRKLHPGDFFARIGGEEFAIVMHIDENKDAYECCEEIRVAVADNKTSKFSLTVSIGLAFPKNQALDESLKVADKALYAAKEQGRNRICAGIFPVRGDARIQKEEDIRIDTVSYTSGLSLAPMLPVEESLTVDELHDDTPEALAS